MSQLKRTPLFTQYSAYNARCIDFGGWELPVQFSGILQEHEAVRQHAGLFDCSHMGEVLVVGTFAEVFLQRMLTNDINRLENGGAQYTLMCYPDGGVVDDLLVYRFTQDYFMLVVNAANIDKDLEWLTRHLIGDVEITDVSGEMALLAIQGPLGETILSQVTDVPLTELKSFRFVPDANVAGEKTLLSRTGYTGEDGFELYLPAKDAIKVWQSLLLAGEPFGLLPAGLGARDSLRFEACFPLYGQELSPSISPLEAGAGLFVKLNKGDFIGREALLQLKTVGLPRKLAGIAMIDRGIPRPHYQVLADSGERIGEMTSGTHSPTLKQNLGLALLASDHAKPGTEVWVDVRGKRLKAQVVPTPFYKRR